MNIKWDAGMGLYQKYCTIYAILFDRLTELKGENGLKDWINMFVKTPFTVIRNEDEKRMIIDKVVGNLQDILYQDGKWYADYVRIRMKATRQRHFK